MKKLNLNLAIAKRFCFDHHSLHVSSLLEQSLLLSFGCSRISFLCLCKERNKESTADFDAELLLPRSSRGQNRRYELNFIEHFLSHTLQDGMSRLC